MLDVPNFFWESEPTLHPLYVAIRDYLEIDPRIKVLNERCRVFLDLAEILADSVADSKMSYITWIIIVLIIISIIVTVTEVTLRFAILEREKAKGGASVGEGGGGGENDSTHAPGNVIGGGGNPAQQIDLRSLGLDGAGASITLEDLRLWAASLNEREKAAVCGAEHVGRTFAGV